MGSGAEAGAGRPSGAAAGGLDRRRRLSTDANSTNEPRAVT